jgi:hypothetical protein
LSDKEIQELKRTVEHLENELLGPRQRRRESTNFLLVILTGLFVGISTSAIVDAIATYSENAGAVTNHPRFAVTVVSAFVGLVLAAWIYQHYKTVNEVVSYDTITYPYTSEERVHDVCKIIEAELKDSELIQLGCSVIVVFDRRSKGITKGMISVVKAWVGPFGSKRVASLDVTEGRIEVDTFLDPDGDTARAVITSKLHKLGAKGINVELASSQIAVSTDTNHKVA